MVTLDGARALAWRLAQQALAPVSASSIADAVRRVLAVRGWPTAPADLAIRLRQTQPGAADLDSALEAGEVIRSYAFRGGSYVMTHDVAAVLLAVRTTSRVWASRRYQRQGGFEIDDWQPVREAIHDLLAGGPATRDEIRAHLMRSPSLAHLDEGATGAGADSLYKPLHWWGDICFGPTRDDGTATFRLLDDAAWPGRLDVDEAGREAVTQYLGAYGPATPDGLGYWLVDGLSVPRRRLQSWIADLGDAVAEIEVDGEPALAMAADVEAMAMAEPADALLLLPAFDPWINGPGTADRRILAVSRRAVASRGANLVVQDGLVHGTWRVRHGVATVSWFAEAGAVPAESLDAAVRRLAELRGRPLRLEVEVG